MLVNLLLHDSSETFLEIPLSMISQYYVGSAGNSSRVSCEAISGYWQDSSRLRDAINCYLGFVGSHSYHTIMKQASSAESKHNPQKLNNW